MKSISRQKLYKKSPYPIHLAFGHEKIASALSIVKDQNDKFCLTHRNIHFNIALSKKDEIKKIIDETLVLKSGINHGKYGCMTMRNKNAGILYTSSILGNNISVGLGIASTLTNDSICWIQVGDGSIEEGAFYEALHFAVSRKLRVIFLLEDNNWSLGTSIIERRYNFNIAKLAKSLNVSYILIPRNCKDLFFLAKFQIARLCCLEFSKPLILHIQTRTLGVDDQSQHPRQYVSYHHGTLPCEQ